MLRPCIEPACPALTPKTRCPEHQRQRERQRGSATQRGYGVKHREARRKTLRRTPFCVRCYTTGTKENPLTADHIVAKVKGGATAEANYQTLCRDCNSAKGSRDSG